MLAMVVRVQALQQLVMAARVEVLLVLVVNNTLIENNKISTGSGGSGGSSASFKCWQW